jgi:hypothetical protein
VQKKGKPKSRSTPKKKEGRKEKKEQRRRATNLQRPFETTRLTPGWLALA